MTATVCSLLTNCALQRMKESAKEVKHASAKLTMLLLFFRLKYDTLSGKDGSVLGLRKSTRSSDCLREVLVGLAPTLCQSARRIIMFATRVDSVRLAVAVFEAIVIKFK